MKIPHRVLVPGLILAWLISSLGKAKEPDPTVDSVLAKWEEASQKVKTLDAKLTVWRYDQVFDRDHQPTITQGRFYYEAPNLGRYEIRKTAKGATNDWSSISEAIIWTGKETLWIEGDTHLCRQCSTAKLQSMLSEPEENDFGWWPVFACLCAEIPGTQSAPALVDWHSRQRSSGAVQRDDRGKWWGYPPAGVAETVGGSRLLF